METVMKSEKRYSTLILVALVLLAACQTAGRVDPTGADDNPTMTASTSTAAATVTPSDVPSPTHLMTRTPYPPTPISQPRPDILHSPLGEDILFSGDNACELPCWYGLRIGESRVEDILITLRQAVGVSPEYVFIMGEDPQFFGVNSGYVTFDWVGDSVEGRGPELFSIGTQFSPQTGILSNLKIDTTVPAFLEQSRPQRILKELGEPSEIWVLVQMAESTDKASLRVYFIYPPEGSRHGVYASWRTLIPVKLNQDPDSSQIATWCLNGAVEQEDEAFLLRIPPPVVPEAHASSKRYFESLETAFELTPKDLYQKALQEPDTCLSYRF